MSYFADASHRNFIVWVSGDPRVSQSLVDIVARTWLQTTQLLNQIFSEWWYCDTIVNFKPLELHDLEFILGFIFPLLKDGVSASS